MMQSEKLSKVFQRLSQDLAGVEYALLGSLNLLLQGVPTDPQDVDLLTTDEGVRTMSNVFGSAILNDHEYLETTFYIKDIEVHAVSHEGNPVRPDDAMKKAISVEAYGHIIPCMSLESELEAYKKMNRDKDQEKIQLLTYKLAH